MAGYNTEALAAASRRKVKAVAAEESPASHALFEMIAGRRVRWEYQQWNAVLAALDSCELTIGEWLSRSKQ